MTDPNAPAPASAEVVGEEVLEVPVDADRPEPPDD